MKALILVGGGIDYRPVPSKSPLTSVSRRGADDEVLCSGINYYFYSKDYFSIVLMFFIAHA